MDNLDSEIFRLQLKYIFIMRLKFASSGLKCAARVNVRQMTMIDYSSLIVLQTTATLLKLLRAITGQFSVFTKITFENWNRWTH